MDFQRLQCEIKYDGKSLESNEMDINELAPALLSFGESMTKISRFINPSKNAVCNVKVRAFNKGSFISDLVIETIQTNPEVVGGALTGLGAAGVKILYDLFIEVVKIKLFKKNNKDIKIEQNFNGQTTLINGDVTITVPHHAFEIDRQGILDRELRTIVEPLKEDSIEKLEFRTKTRSDECLITQEQKEFFYQEEDIRLMTVSTQGYIENMHKKYRTFGLVSGKTKIPCYIPAEEHISAFSKLFDASLVKITGEAEVDENNKIIKIKVTSGEIIQDTLFAKNEESDLSE